MWEVIRFKVFVVDGSYPCFNLVAPFFIHKDTPGFVLTHRAVKLMLSTPFSKSIISVWLVKWWETLISKGKILRSLRQRLTPEQLTSLHLLHTLLPVTAGWVLQGNALLWCTRSDSRHVEFLSYSLWDVSTAGKSELTSDELCDKRGTLSTVLLSRLPRSMSLEPEYETQELLLIKSEKSNQR